MHHALIQTHAHALIRIFLVYLSTNSLSFSVSLSLPPAFEFPFLKDVPLALDCRCQNVSNMIEINIIT